jgi:ribonuclease P protein component
MIFTTQYKLRDKAGYTKVFTKPTVKKHQANLMLLASQNNMDHPRLGLAIAKKHAKRAVDRSQIKRIIRESFRENIQSIKAFDIVFISKFGIQALDKRKLRTITDNFFENLK